MRHKQSKPPRGAKEKIISEGAQAPKGKAHLSTLYKAAHETFARYCPPPQNLDLMRAASQTARAERTEQHNLHVRDNVLYRIKRGWKWRLNKNCSDGHALHEKPARCTKHPRVPYPKSCSKLHFKLD